MFYRPLCWKTILAPMLLNPGNIRLLIHMQSFKTISREKAERVVLANLRKNAPYPVNEWRMFDYFQHPVEGWAYPDWFGGIERSLLSHGLMHRQNLSWAPGHADYFITPKGNELLGGESGKDVYITPVAIRMLKRMQELGREEMGHAELFEKFVDDTVKHNPALLPYEAFVYLNEMGYVVTHSHSYYSSYDTYAITKKGRDYFEKFGKDKPEDVSGQSAVLVTYRRR